MTTFRSSGFAMALPALFLLVRAANAEEPAPAARDGCSNIAPAVERECIGRRIAAKEAQMRDLLPRARAAVGRSHAAYGRLDNRTRPQLLDRSQAAWRNFVDANCAVTAAFGGGSNSAISDREAACLEEEINRRLSFLRDLSESTGLFAR